MKIICISGKAQHGKDTAAGFLKEILESSGYTVLIAHYADLLKYICRQFFDWNGKKDESGRQILQYVGTDIIRQQKPDFWVNFLVEILTLFSTEWDYVLIPDCRFPNEIDVMKQEGFNVVGLRIERKNFISPLTQEQQNHPSETALDHYMMDDTIVNDGTLEQFRVKLKHWLEEQNV